MKNFIKNYINQKKFNSKNIIFFHKDEKFQNKNLVSSIDLKTLNLNYKKLKLIKKFNPNKDLFTLYIWLIVTIIVLLIFRVLFSLC